VLERYNIVNERDLSDGVAKLAVARNRQICGKPAPCRAPACARKFNRIIIGGGSGLVVRLVFKTSWGPSGPR
jgi:hypothetical protein